MGTSAAYLIACGTNKIYADEMSLIGSIGVLIDSFGSSDLLKKIGVERREPKTPPLETVKVPPLRSSKEILFSLAFKA